MAERIKWVDIYKGIAILLVVIGHTDSPVGGYVYLFHVAAFFFISGYTANLTKGSALRYTLHKFTSWMVPFFTANILLLTLRALLHTFHIEKLFYADAYSSAAYWSALCQTLTSWKPLIDLAGITWFLTVLFFTAVMAKIMHDVYTRFPKPDWWLLGTAAAVLGCAFWLYRRPVAWWANFDLSLHALFYFVAGYLFRKHEVFQTKINPFYAAPMAVFFLFFYKNVHWAGVVWPMRAFGNPLNTLVASFAGIYLTYLLAAGLARLNAAASAFTYLGARTMAIMLYHFLAFRVCYGLFFLAGLAPAQQMQNLVPPSRNAYWHLLTALSVLMVLGADYLALKNPWLNKVLYGFGGNDLADWVLRMTRRKHSA